jgi:two-component system LytT family response regulator
MTIRVVVADDEPLSRQRMVRLIQSEPDAELVSVCSDGEEALQAIRTLEPDLVMLDVQMPVRDGFEVLSELKDSVLPAVVFVTAYDTYALQAFEAAAVDYLLKPFEEERFHRAFARAREVVGRQTGEAGTRRLLALLDSLPRQGGGAERLAVKREGRVYFVRTSDIDWVEAASNYVKLHVGREAHLLRESMTNLSARLDPNRFLRIHRTTIVNVDRIREIQPWFSGEYVVILGDGTKLKVSRGYREEITRWLGQAI